jgi:hypothetical protein
LQNSKSPKFDCYNSKKTPTRRPASPLAAYLKKRDVNHPRFSISILAPSMKFSGPCSMRTTQQKVATAKNVIQSTKRKYRTRRYYPSAVSIARSSGSRPSRTRRTDYLPLRPTTISKTGNDDEDVNENGSARRTPNVERQTLNAKRRCYFADRTLHCRRELPSLCAKISTASF